MKKLFAVQGVVVLLLTLAYIGLTFYALACWNEALAGGLIGGFIAFAQSTIRRFFDWLDGQSEPPTTDAPK